MTQVEAVVLDYGGVMTTPMGDSIRAWIAADGIDPQSFSRTLKAWLARDAPAGTPIHRLETGELDADEFGVLLAAELARHDGEPVDPEGLLGRLFAEIRVESAMFDLVADLRPLGVRTGLLSNSWGDIYPRERIAAAFDHVVISAEVGLRKPQPEIFRLALDGLGVAAGQAVFVDDAEPNLIGARAVGLRTILHTDPVTTRAELVALVPGLRPTPTGRGAIQ
ncbi:putative hydrolase of the HAD superfamily [Nocardioides terrae]|uniref:Putative hydrolase of the HAD superfamily n=1 Tax=Nocardioides terrae TaxID=574651 RepID=A0A1I1LRQ0_9ACTN|nr:HAD family phosphatase [Nocardioides terrae]SFC72120.1 putative hydrolase of the HAD superfamily [Nocardioides terrae]